VGGLYARSRLILVANKVTVKSLVLLGALLLSPS